MNTAVCRDGNLFDAWEFRCCRVANTSRILTFDGSIERASCVAQHKNLIAHEQDGAASSYSTTEGQRGPKVPPSM